MHSYGELEGHQPQISIVIPLNKCIHMYVYTCSQASIHAQLMFDFMESQLACEIPFNSNSFVPKVQSLLVGILYTLVFRQLH